jgi:UDP-sugar transporter A1/2/3
MALSTSSLLLIAYVCCETIRANYAYYAFHNFPYISATIVTLLSEVLKLCVAAFFLLKSNDALSISELRKFLESAQIADIDFKKTGKYALPAALYLANNLIYYTVLPLTTPSLLQVCVLAKLPTTGILHHYMIKPQRNIYAWFSLLGLCFGLVAFNVPSKLHEGSGEIVAAWYLAPVAGFIIACLSALASISSETTLKEGDFWESQAYLYSWGIIFAAIAYPLAPSSGYHAEQGEVPAFALTTVVLILVGITAGTGLVVAVILCTRDNVLKVIGTAASLVTIAASQFVLLPELRASTFTPWKLCGGGLVTTATWCYNYYSQQPWPSSAQKFEAIPGDIVEEEEEEHPPPRIESFSVNEAEKGTAESEGAEEASVDHIFRPNATKILICVIFTAFVTYEVALRQGD